MKRFLFVASVLGLAGVSLPAQQSARPTRATFDVFEASIPDMQAAMKAGRTTSHDIVQQYLTRIAKYEDLLHAAITVNPKALEEADERDRERARGPRARAAARDPDRAQGQRPHDRPAHHRRGARVRVAGAALRSDADEEPA
jgi:hypothetical protein